MPAASAGSKRPASQAAPIGIVVVNYGSSEMIERNLGQLCLDRNETRVIVVDNYHTPAEVARVSDLVRRRRWELVLLDRNAGFGAAVNVGAARAAALGCESLLLLNPDAWTTAEVIDELRTACHADRNALITPVIDRSDGSEWFSGGRIAVRWGGLLGPHRPVSEHRVAWVTGACLALHVDLWERLDGFDEDYFLYWEDVDLSFRCHRLGGRVVVRRDLRAVHEVGATQGTGRKSAAYHYFNCRNRLMFAGKHLRTRHRLIWMLQTPMDTARVLTRGGRSSPLDLRRVLLPGLKGVASGARWLAGSRPG